MIMRSTRPNTKWDRETGGGYNSSSEEEDERSRLKKPGGYIRRSSEATSPNESDNMYAEANLLHDDNKGQDLSDSEVYGGSNGSSQHRYQIPHQSIVLRSPHKDSTQGRPSRPNNSQTDGKGHFYGTSNRSGRMSSSSSSNLPTRRAANGPLPDPPTTNRRGQLDWGIQDSGGLVETRLGTGREAMEYGSKYGNSLHFQQPLTKSRHQQQSIVSSSGGSSSSTTKNSSLHRRSLSDDSLSIDKHVTPQSSGGSTSTAVIASAANPNGDDHSTNRHLDPIVMPGFPVRTLQGHPPPPYSPSREKFTIGKKCRFHCSWKLVAFALTFLTIVLSSVIVYFGAVKFPGPLKDVLISEDCATPLSILPAETPMQRVDSNVLKSSSARRAGPVTVTLVPGRPYEVVIEPMRFWRSRLPVQRPGTFRLNLTFMTDLSTPPSRDVAIYGKARFPPSVTNYDWIHIVSNGELKKTSEFYGFQMRSRRAADSSISLTEAFPIGDMFLAVLNDGLAPTGIRITTEKLSSSEVPADNEASNSIPSNSDSKPSDCLNNCSGKGTCLRGECVCNPRFTGIDCALSVCPLLCSGNGVYRGGKCLCSPGWKGNECDVKLNECTIPDCNGNGRCSDEGVCECEEGWMGEACDQRDCLVRDCNGNGFCRQGRCHCYPGWMGSNCDERNEALLQCLPDCSGNGIFDYASGLCDCKESWTGKDCNITLCSLDCGARGSCMDGSCICESGWTGSGCSSRNCDARCGSHGQCRDGKCLCQRGWNGKHCTLNGCGSDGKCNDRGKCDVNPSGEYECDCNYGWTGRYCESLEETDCEDGIDNDENGLTDCGDSRCCSHPSCKKNIMCVYLADPVEVLSLKPPPSVASSFFERVQFLFEGQKSVQSYAKKDAFDPKRASIIRGRVITRQGQGIIGVRVSVDRMKEASSYGFTLTRPGGWFDMVINGGGAVTLQFQRSPLKAMTRTTYIPWNRMVVINPVVMTSYGGVGISRDEEDTSLQVSYFEPCKPHDYESVKPIIFSSYTPLVSVSRTGYMSPETRTFISRFPVPGTETRLVYTSASSPGYKSIIDLRLTPSDIPRSLDNITVKIVIAGGVFRKTFEADPSLKYVFTWDKKNVYRQKVYGVSKAEVSVGYHYRDCLHTIWNSRTVNVRGFDAPISDIGGWNFDIHHHFNPNQGILLKGDGSRYAFDDKKAKLIMGKGIEKRPFECRPNSLCEGDIAADLSLLEVLSMTTGPDGSLYVGDFNVIRKIKPDKSVISLLYLGEKEGKYTYDLKISPADNKLYVTIAERYQVIQIKDLSEEINPFNNSVIVVGTGKRCLPGDRDACGDGGKALQARLSYPKGIAISVDKTMYISDGQNIRTVSPEGDISTLIGHHKQRDGPPKPLGCQKSFLASQIQLQWPTKLALNPLDSSLHIVDDSIVLRLTPDLRVVTVGGVSPLCPSSKQNIFGPIADLSFSSEYGTLYIASGGMVYSIDADGNVRNFQSSSNRNCLCPDNEIEDCSINCIRIVNSIAIDGSFLFISDSSKILMIQKVSHNKPSSKEIRITDPVSREIYTFNAFGQHLFTQSGDTGLKIHEFVYSKTPGLGQLSEIRHASGKGVSLKRDYSNNVHSMTNFYGNKFLLRLSSRDHRLLEFRVNDRNVCTFEYDDAGLLQSSRKSNGDFIYASYNPAGMLNEIISSFGGNIQLEECSANKEHTREKPHICLILRRNGKIIRTLIVEQDGNTYIKSDGKSRMKVNVDRESVTLTLQNSREFSISSTNSEGLKRDVRLTKMIQKRGKTLLGSIIWEEAGQTEGQLKLLKINGENVLKHRFRSIDGSDLEESVSNQAGLLMRVNYKNGVLPEHWSFSYGENCSRSYDSYNRLTEHHCEGFRQCVKYSAKNGLIRERSTCQNLHSIKYSYSSSFFKPTSVELPSGRIFTYDYDEFGGLAGIHIPNCDTSFRFKSQIHFGGKIKYYHFLPGIQEPYVYYYSSSGRLLEVRPPLGNGVSLFKYDALDRITHYISADVKSVFKRHNSDDEITRIETTYNNRDNPFTMKEVYWRNSGRNERSIYFNSESGFASALFRYNDSFFDGRIGGQALPRCRNEGIKIVWENPALKGREVGEFIATRRRLNESLVTDGLAFYSRGHNFLVLEIRGREYFRATYDFNENGLLSSEAVTNYYRRTKEILISYFYDVDDRLIRAGDSEYQYDGAQGNLIKISIKTKWKKKKSFHLHYRPGTFLRSDMQYDEAGRRIIEKEMRFEYSAIAGADCLSRVFMKDIEIKYVYDHIGRLTGRVKGERVTQYFYGYMDSPYKISHVFEPESGLLASLKYDDRGGLIYLDINGKKYYVANDYVGSPMVFLFISGGRSVKVAREIRRSPFGVIMSDSSPDFPISIDFLGGIRDFDTGLIHFQDADEGACRVYDPKSVSYLTPRWRKISEKPYDPISLNIYGFKNYNPNKRKGLSFFNEPLDRLKDILKSSYDILSEKQVKNIFPSDERGNMLYSLTSAEEEFLKRFERIIDLSHFPSKSDEDRRTEISRTDPALGRFVIYDEVFQRVVSVSDGTVNQVQRSVFTQVLDGAQLVDFKTVPRDDDMLFFTKPKIRPDDVTALRRLGPAVNLTIHESQTSEKDVKMLDVKVHLKDTILNIRYGTSPELEKSRLLRHAYKTVSRKAWLRERTSSRWSPREIQNILSQGFVPGYRTRYRLKEVDIYPELATDINNIEIVPESNTGLLD